MLKTMLYAALLTITTASCSTTLPADFPKAPVIDLCTNVVLTQVYDAQGNPLALPKAYDKQGREVPLVGTFWRCQKTDSKEIRSMPPKHVQFGVPAADWNKGQEFRRAVEEYTIEKDRICK